MNPSIDPDAQGWLPAKPSRTFNPHRNLAKAVRKSPTLAHAENLIRDAMEAAMREARENEHRADRERRMPPLVSHILPIPGPFPRRMQ